MSSKSVSLLGTVARSASFGLLKKDSSGLTYIHALRGINIELKEGARLGVIGRNGSGKSTLLRTLAGIHFPSPGQRLVRGSVASVLSIGAGLDMEKTGRQNVQLSMRIFGTSSSLFSALEQEIAEFTELNQFFDLPVRTYSSGMLLRLSFAIATAIDGDILIIDEILGAGDLHFLERASKRILNRSAEAKILVMATHNLSALEQFCDHTIWIHAGRIIMQGPPKEVWQAYCDSNPAMLASDKSQAVAL